MIDIALRAFVQELAAALRRRPGDALVRLEHPVARGHRLEAREFEALRLEAGDDLADEAPGDGLIMM